MAYAYALSPGPERDSALSSIKIRFKECTEALKKIECEFEASIGSIMIEMKGIQGFARICPGDVFEITIKYGEGQKWKSRGKILKNNDQVWDNQSVTFKALIDSVLSIKAVEVRGFGKNITLGNKLCETRSLFSAHPQLMTVNLNNIGTLKLNLVVTWNPLHGVSGSLFKSQSLLSKSSSSLFGSMRSLPALFSGSSLSGKKSSDRSGTLPVHCRIPVSVTRSDLFSETVNHSNVSCNSPQYAAAAAASSACQMKKSASAMAGITVKCNSDSTSSGSTSSSLHLMGTTASSGFGSGSSYCSGSTSVPSSALTSPDCESAPIILSSVSRQALPIHSTSPSASYYFNINSYLSNSSEAKTSHRGHAGSTFAVANAATAAAAAAAASSSSASHRHSSSGLFNATQFPAGVVGSGAAAAASIAATGGLLSGGTSSFKNNNNNSITSSSSSSSSSGHGNNCQPTSRMYLSASASNLSRGGSGVSSSASSSSAYGSGRSGQPADSQRRGVRPMSQIVKINLDSQQFNSNGSHTSKGEVNNYSSCSSGPLNGTYTAVPSNSTSTAAAAASSTGNNSNNGKLFHSSVKSRLFDRSYNEDIIEVADESTDCSSDLTDCSPSKGSMGTNDANAGQMMMMIPSSGEEDDVILSPAGPPKPILPSSCPAASTSASTSTDVASNGSSHPALFSSFACDDRRLTSATSRSSVYPLASDYINLSDALINLISSLEDIQGQYTQTQALQVNVQNLFKVIKDISAFAANQVKRSNQQRQQQQLLLQKQQQQQQDDDYKYESQLDSYNHSFSELMINNNNYSLPGNTYGAKVNGNNDNNNGSNSFIYSNNCKNSSKNNSPCKSSSKLLHPHSSHYLRGNNNHHQQSQQLNRCNLGSRTGSFTSDYSFAVESALQSFDFLNTAASDNDSSFNGCDNGGSHLNRSHHQHHLIDNLSKSTDHLNASSSSCSGVFKNRLTNGAATGERDNRKLGHGFSLNLHEQVTSFMTPHAPHTASLDDESADEDDEDVENELNGRHDVNHLAERTIYTPRRSKSSAEHLTFTTGSRQFDLAILHHISHCQRLLLDVGQFGPLKERENASLARLADHATVMGKLCCLCQHIRDYTREINLLQEDNEEGDILRLQAAEALYIQRVDQQLAHLFDDSRLTCIWQVVTQQHLSENIDLFTDSSCPLITVTVSQFISSLKWILSKCLQVNTSTFAPHDSTLARSISTGSLSRGSFTNDQIYTQIAHLMTRRVLDNCAYDSDSILTVFQLHLFFKCDNLSSHGNGSGATSSSKSLDHLLQELYNEQTTLLALSSNDAIRVKQCLNRFKKNVPPREPLCHIGLLALQNNDPLIARIAETYFLDARKNKSQRKEVSHRRPCFSTIDI